MDADTAPMTRRGLVAYGVAVAGATLLTADATIRAVVLAYDLAEKVTALAIAGWLAASFIPILLSALIWVMDRRVKPRWRWLPHLLFLPTAIAAVRLGSSLYLRETGLLPDSMMTEFTLFAATAYLALALIVHLGAFVAAVARATHKPDGS